MRTPADYDVYLTEKVRAFERDQPAVYQRIRLLVTILLGMPREPQERVTQLALEMQTRLAVQILKNLPTCDAWMRGDDA